MARKKVNIASLKRKYAPAVEFAKAYIYTGDNQDEVAIDAFDLLKTKLADMEDEVIEDYPSVIGKPIIGILNSIQGDLDDLIEYYDNRL
jgi:hypothetical protein